MKGQIVHAQRIFCDITCKWKWQITIELENAPTVPFKNVEIIS